MSYSNQVMYNDVLNSNFNNNINDLYKQECDVLSRIFLDIRVASDVCKNLYIRVKELEQIIETKHKSLIITNSTNATAPLYTQQPCAEFTGGAEEGGWIPVVDRRKQHQRPYNYLPPPPLPTRNSFELLGNCDRNFPSLEEAAARGRQRPSTTSGDNGESPTSQLQ
jgi:hypothetical protein